MLLCSADCTIMNNELIRHFWTAFPHQFTRDYTLTLYCMQLPPNTCSNSIILLNSYPLNICSNYPHFWVAESTQHMIHQSIIDSILSWYSHECNCEERIKNGYYLTIYWTLLKIHCFNLAPELYPFQSLATCTCAAGMPAYTEITSHLRASL